jgi:hypothetical protein
VSDTTVTVDATKAGVTADVPAAPALDPVAALVRPVADARTAAGGALPLAADPIPWDQVERVTAAHVAAERAAAAKALATPDADITAVESELYGAVAATLADFDRARDALARDYTRVPEWKAAARAELDADEKTELALTIRREEARLSEAERRAQSWVPDLVPAARAAADLRVADELIRQRDKLGPKHFIPTLARAIADPANAGAVRAALPYLKDAYETAGHRLHADGDLRRLIEAAEGYAVDRHDLVRAGRLADVQRLRGIDLDQVRRNPRFAVAAAGFGSSADSRTRDRANVPFVHG